jgi:hypothetical protein
MTSDVTSDLGQTPFQMTIILGTQKETPINYKMEPLLKLQVASNGYTVQKLGYGECSETSRPSITRQDGDAMVTCSSSWARMDTVSSFWSSTVKDG